MKLALMMFTGLFLAIALHKSEYADWVVIAWAIAWGFAARAYTERKR